jgi:hypothetical protein
LARWQQANPEKPAEAYVFATRGGLPRDPQLRYYWGKGFKRIVACEPNYFPHEASLDYGAVIRGRIPLFALAPVWKRLHCRGCKALNGFYFWCCEFPYVLRTTSACTQRP